METVRLHWLVSVELSIYTGITIIGNNVSHLIVEFHAEMAAEQETC